MNYIVLDLEFNQSYPFKTGTFVAPVAECPFEIIQIGAVKLNENFEIIDGFDQIVQPQIYPRIHPFVEKITGIKNEDFIDQPTFPTVYQNFVNFIGEEDCILCTWGVDDVKALFRNILFHKLPVDKISHKYVNVQTYANVYLKYEAGKAVGLKNAAEELQIELDEPFHNAYYDAKYTAKIFQVVKPEKIKFSVFRPLALLITPVKSPKTNTGALYQHITDVMERELTSTEKKLIKIAYYLGRAHSFDAPQVTKKKKKSPFKKENKKENND